ncbi:hypothetical protein XA68_18105 [Ophiocordyceps unilateralis]|uniref:LSM2-LSM8 complex subunit LSM8 n=2 Tax=Hypocreales TaxID=5125 RepID=A0A2A9PI27_OPHUN|nr:hypothetical protein XA68_18105 [Ophiocordyceps unilateralis]
MTMLQTSSREVEEAILTMSQLNPACLSTFGAVAAPSKNFPEALARSPYRAVHIFSQVSLETGGRERPSCDRRRRALSLSGDHRRLPARICVGHLGLETGELQLRSSEPARVSLLVVASFHTSSPQPKKKKKKGAPSSMMATLGGYLNKKVLVVTVDSRTLIGTLLAADHSTNLVLDKAVERVIREPDDPENSLEVKLGVYVVRGDNVCVVGLVDESLDQSIDWTQVRGSLIGSTKHV